jgi:hypothetical protein
MLKILTTTGLAAVLAVGLALGPGVGSAVAAPWGWHHHPHHVCHIVWRHHHPVKVCAWR